MAYREEYRELLEGAEGALYALLVASTQDSWLTLRRGYGEIRQLLEREDGERKRIQSLEENTRERKEAEAAWTALAMSGRESLVLEVLGEDRLSVKDLTERINRSLVPEGSRWCALYESNLRSLVARMFTSGQLERAAEPGARLRYRYFRKRGLDGPIADLERAFQDADGEAS